MRRLRRRVTPKKVLDVAFESAGVAATPRKTPEEEEPDAPAPPKAGTSAAEFDGASGG